jgi:hypothetical protein
MKKQRRSKILVYGKYTQKQWNAMSFEEATRVMEAYRRKVWREQWIAQYKLITAMGTPGGQLQPYRA